MEVWTDRRPRETYGPRSLLPAPFGSRPETRLYGKGMEIDRGVEALPAETAVLCPNRIRERRIQAGFDNTMAFARHIDAISYQRLMKIETGRVVVRESEYELVADALRIKVEDLKLPLLTRSETAQWNERLGVERRLEEGGDHDSVLLSAYVRKLVEATGSARTTILREWGYHSNTLCRVWHAEKPIDRYPDSTMAVVIRLAHAESWDAVILNSRQLYADHALADEIRAVQEPRVRYAPEDPDRRAPWSYSTDPFRARMSRAQTLTPLSAGMVERIRDRRQREKEEGVRQRQEYRSLMQRVCRDVVDEARTGDVREMLERFYPEESRAALERVLADDAVARTIVARTALLRFVDDGVKLRAASSALGITIERFRQISSAYRGRISDLSLNPNHGSTRIIQ